MLTLFVGLVSMSWPYFVLWKLLTFFGDEVGYIILLAIVLALGPELQTILALGVLCVVVRLLMIVVMRFLGIGGRRGPR